MLLRRAERVLPRPSQEPMFCVILKEKPTSHLPLLVTTELPTDLLADAPTELNLTLHIITTILELFIFSK